MKSILLVIIAFQLLLTSTWSTTSPAISVGQYPNIGPSRSASVLIVVPGHGIRKRWGTLKASILALRKSTLGTSVIFNCVIYGYNLIYNPQLRHTKLCEIVESRGYWTHHMLKVNASGYSHVAVMMDDVNVTRVNLTRAIGTMDYFNYDMASAAMDGWHYVHMRPSPSCWSHEVNFVDVLFTVFTANTWACWVANIDININPMGWGYDLTMKDLCHIKAGVLDREVGRHGHGEFLGEQTSGMTSRSYNSTAARNQIQAWIGKVYGITDNVLQSETVAMLQKNKYPHGNVSICAK